MFNIVGFVTPGAYGAVRVTVGDGLRPPVPCRAHPGDMAVRQFPIWDKAYFVAKGWKTVLRAIDACF